MSTLIHPTPIETKPSRTMQPRHRWRALWIWLPTGSLILGVALYLLFLWPWLSRWGTTPAEAYQALPGDDLVTDPALVTTKAITIDAPPEAIWPWLVQLGVDRGGMYSYLWVENWLLRLNVENSDSINPGWQTLQVGDFIRFTPKDFALNPGPGLYVIEIQPNYALVGCFGIEGQTADCSQSATWQFILQTQPDHSTRLLLRSRTAGPTTLLTTNGGKIAAALQFYMERKMLLGLKERAERFAMFQRTQ